VSGEVRGAVVPLRYTKFIVTSQYKIEKIWEEDEETKKAVLRRFKQIHIVNCP